MIYWHKTHGFEDFLTIARYCLDKDKIDDRVDYRNYPSPFYHVKTPYTIKGLNSKLKDWAKDCEGRNEEQSEAYHISSLDTFLSRNLSYKNGKDGKKQFKEASIILHYFKREADFLATN